MGREESCRELEGFAAAVVVAAEEFAVVFEDDVVVEALVATGGLALRVARTVAVAAAVEEWVALAALAAVEVAAAGEVVELELATAVAAAVGSDCWPSSE